MNIFFVSHTSGKYGASRSLLDLIEGLEDRGHRCKVALPKDGRLVDELRGRGVPYQVIPYKWWVSDGGQPGKRAARTIYNLGMSIPLAWAAMGWHADVVYTNSSVTPVGALAAAAMGKPHIWHIREFAEEDYGYTFDLGFPRSARIMNGLSDHIIFISEALFAKYSPYTDSGRASVIYNGFHSDAAVTSAGGCSVGVGSDSPPRVAILGRLQHGKGQMDAVLAVSEIHRQGRAVRLDIVGDGERSYREQLEHVAQENGIGHLVRFVGYVDDPREIMASSLAVLVCSRAEAFGRVTAEAMSLGKAVIGANSGATPELVNHGVNGLLYEYGNSRDLALKIMRFVGDPEEAIRQGKNGLRVVRDRFGMDGYVNGILELIQRAVDVHG